MKLLTQCPICNSIEIYNFSKKKLFVQSNNGSLTEAENQFLLLNLKKSRVERNLYLCRECSFLFQNPTYGKEDLKNLYGATGSNIKDCYQCAKKSEIACWSLSAKNNLAKRRERYANAITSIGKNHILDYGGNRGGNLQHPSLNHKKRCVYDFGRDRSPENGIRSIKNLDSKLRFDFILHTHVLEHEPDPLFSMRKLRKLVTPNGVLYLEVPFEYAERLLTRRPGSIWHVNYFNRKTIIEIANRTAWKCESIKISNNPYNHFYMNCITAILSPRSNETFNTHFSNLQVVKDMGLSLVMRLGYAVLRG